jgi:hypothetical protein
LEISSHSNKDLLVEVFFIFIFKYKNYENLPPKNYCLVHMVMDGEEKYGWRENG